MKNSLQTERLQIRKLTLKDSNFIVQLLNSPGWLKYIGDRGVSTLEDAKIYLQNGPLLSYKKHGFGLYMVELLSANVPIGICGILQRDYLVHPDLGFAFLPEFTGKGYAFEAAKAVIQFAGKQLDVKELLAITLPGNTTSIKLLEKAGMKYQEMVKSQDGTESLKLFSLKLNEESPLDSPHEF